MLEWKYTLKILQLEYLHLILPPTVPEHPTHVFHPLYNQFHMSENRHFTYTRSLDFL